MQRITISLPDEVANSLRREARRQGTSVSSIAREALIERLKLSTGAVREIPFAALGASGTTDTARRAEEILAEDWAPDSRS